MLKKLLNDLKKSNPHIAEIVTDIPYYFIAKVTNAISGFVGIAVYTQLLIPKEYGAYVLTLTTVSFVYVFAFSWIWYVIWRYFERYKNTQNLSLFLSTIIYTAVIIFFVIAFIWYMVSIFSKTLFEQEFIQVLRLGILVIGTQVGYTIVLSILQASRQSFKYSLYTIIHTVGTLLLAVILIRFLSLRAEAILLASAILMGGIFILEMFQVSKTWQLSIQHFSVNLLKKVSSFGSPQIGISIGAIVLSIFDRYAIGFFRGPEYVGIYSAGYTIADMSIQLPLSILTVTTVPIIVQTFENNGKNEAQLILEKLICISLIVFLPVVFGITALSKSIVDIVLGEHFQFASVVLPWVVAGVFFFGLTQYINIPFQLKEKPYLLFYLILGAAIVNIILNFILIPMLGIVGAAYATLIAYFIYFIASYVTVNRFFSFLFPWLTFIKSFSASLIMYLFISSKMVSMNDKFLGLTINIFLGVLVYFTSLVILKERTILQYFKRIKGVV